MDKRLSDTVKSELKEFIQFRWRPSADLLIAIVSYLILVGVLYVAFQIITMENLGPSFILYGFVAMLSLGIITPAVYVVFIKKQALSEIGISKKYWLLSIILGIVLGVITYFGTLATIDLPPFMELLPLAFMAITVGLFEAIFFRGWIQLRFENAFGAIPAIPIGAAFYALYHVGYGMSGSEVLFLFFLGLTFAIAFRVTKNVLVLWPFYTWVGGLYTNITEGQVLPFEALYGFVIILTFMIISIVTIRYIQKRRRNK